MSHNVIVEFKSKGEAQDFIDEVQLLGLIPSGAHVRAYQPLRAFFAAEVTARATNVVNGDAANVVQCQNIDGGVTM